MKPTRMLAMLISFLTLWLALGCVGPARRAALPVTPMDNTARLAKHPQFQRAAASAPEFVIECFETITDLETELANAGR